MYKPDIVFYHKGCADGMAALWAIDTVELDHPHKAKAIAIQYNEPFPIDYDELTGKSVLFVDFFPDDKDLPTIMSKCKAVVIVDHHKTAKERASELEQFDGSMEMLEGFLDVMQEVGTNTICHFDMDKSGARLTWELYHGIEEAPPFLIQYIEDRDIWRWVLPDTHAINAWISSFDYTLGNFHAMAAELEENTASVVEQGKAIQRARDQLINEIAKNAIGVGLLMAPDMEVPVILPILIVTSHVLQSEVGNVLAERSPSSIAAIIHPIRDEPDKLKVSLRSKKPVDITPILKAWGGGGHAQAGGFTVAFAESPFRAT